jgi:hypothetical protein
VENTAYKENNMQCANTEMLNAHMDKEERRERAYTSLMIDLESDLKELDKSKERILKTASDYEGFDFSEDLLEEIKSR